MVIFLYLKSYIAMIWKRTSLKRLAPTNCHRDGYCHGNRYTWWWMGCQFLFCVYSPFLIITRRLPTSAALMVFWTLWLALRASTQATKRGEKRSLFLINSVHDESPCSSFSALTCNKPPFALTRRKNTQWKGTRSFTLTLRRQVARGRDTATIANGNLIHCNVTL